MVVYLCQRNIKRLNEIFYFLQNNEMILLFMYSFNIILCEKIVQQFIIIILISYHSYITLLNKLMFSLTSADEKLVVSQKRNGFFVEKSPIAGIHVNDEVIELNHVKV